MKIIDEQGLTGTFFSEKKETDRQGYSVQIDLVGSFDIDIELQASLNGNEWVTVQKPVSSVLTGITDSDGSSILYDQEYNKHRFVRVKIVVNSGTPDVMGTFSR